MRRTQNHWQFHYKKMFPKPTLWIFVKRRNRSPVYWTSSKSMRNKLITERQSHLMTKRQIDFKRKLKNLFPQKMRLPAKWRPQNHKAKNLRFSPTVK
jgi:hypothetical protein